MRNDCCRIDPLYSRCRLGSREISVNRDSRSRISLSSSFAWRWADGSSPASRRTVSICAFCAEAQRWPIPSNNRCPICSFNSFLARRRDKIAASDFGRMRRRRRYWRALPVPGPTRKFSRLVRPRRRVAKWISKAVAGFPSKDPEQPGPLCKSQPNHAVASVARGATTSSASVLP